MNEKEEIRTEYKIQIDVTGADSYVLLEELIPELQRLIKARGFSYELSPLLGRTVPTDEPPRVTVYEGVGL